MNAPSRWVEVDDQIGVPCVVSVSGPARVTTTAPRVMHRRTGIDAAEAQSRVRAVLAETFGLPDDAVTPEPDGGVTLDLATSSAWIGHVDPAMTVLSETVLTAAAHRPDLRVSAQRATWSDAAQDVGADALSWAVARSSNPRPPVVTTPAFEAWRARTDDNPLSLVRRAHAATTLATLAKDDPVARSDHEAPTAPDALTAGPLRTALLLADRAAHDAERSARARPLALAVEMLASTALEHLERAPEDRTDLPALEGARRVLRDALQAAQVAAPVPY